MRIKVCEWEKIAVLNAARESEDLSSRSRWASGLEIPGETSGLWGFWWASCREPLAHEGCLPAKLSRLVTSPGPRQGEHRCRKAGVCARRARGAGPGFGQGGCPQDAERGRGERSSGSLPECACVQITNCGPKDTGETRREARPQGGRRKDTESEGVTSDRVDNPVKLAQNSRQSGRSSCRHSALDASL